MKLSAPFLIGSLTVVLLAACGRSNTIYSDGGADGIVGTDGRPVLPTGFYDQSVNHATAEIATDAGGAKVLRLSLSGGSSTAGAFNDATAVGSRAILGIGKYDLKALSTFSLALTSASSTSTTAHISLLVDLACDGTSAVRTLESTDLALGSASASVGDAIWSVDGTALTTSSNQILLASKTSNTPSPLTALLAAYPNACLRNSRSDADDAPASIPTGSILLSIGSPSATTAASIDISSLTVNSDVYQTWGQR